MSQPQWHLSVPCNWCVPYPPSFSFTDAKSIFKAFGPARKPQLFVLINNYYLYEYGTGCKNWQWIAPFYNSVTVCFNTLCDSLRSTTHTGSSMPKTYFPHVHSVFIWFEDIPMACGGNCKVNYNVPTLHHPANWSGQWVPNNSLCESRLSHRRFLYPYHQRPFVWICYCLASKY